jgi:glutathione S-transferase
VNIIVDNSQVLTGSFVIRLFSYCKHGFLPADVPAQIERKAPNFYKWAHAVISHESISSTFPEEMVVESTKKLRAREQQKA